ncbi:MAG: hypothetical protein ABR903_07480 [Thermodesulfovibrionales bacterium]
MDSTRMKEIVGILMESTFYFDLSLRERYCLVQRILSISSYAAS